MKVLSYLIRSTFSLGFLLWMELCGLASETKLEVELGNQGSLHRGQTTRQLSYIQPHLLYSTEGTDSSVLWDTHVQGRMTYDAQALADRAELSIRAFNTSLSHSNWKLTLGFQEIPWGETFGPPILDVVNPRDLRDPLLLDPSWTRLPTASAQAQYFFDKTTLQFIVTPKSRYPLLPTPGSNYDLSRKLPGTSLLDQRSLPDPQMGSGTEFGGRVSTLFDNGVDFGVLYYRHMSRSPVYQFRPNPPTIPFHPNGIFNPEIMPVHTLGNTLSYAFSDFVLRQDLALRLGQPFQSDSGATDQVDKGTQLLSVIGLDWTSQESWSLGAQVQIEYDDSEYIHRFLDWVSIRTTYPFWDNTFVLSLFYYRGINNSDSWIQPELTLNLNDHLSISVRGDIVQGSDNPDQGYLWLVEDQSRIFTWVRAEF